MKAIIIGLLISSGLMAQFHSVTLTWQQGPETGATVTGFNVKRSTISGGPYATIFSISGTTVSTYVDTNIVEGTTYYYVVTTTGLGSLLGESDPSNEVSATIPYFVPQRPLMPCWLSPAKCVKH
jgi:fibronectin type 3 domain-containing protein